MLTITNENDHMSYPSCVHCRLFEVKMQAEAESHSMTLSASFNTEAVSDASAALGIADEWRFIRAL